MSRLPSNIIAVVIATLAACVQTAKPGPHGPDEPAVTCHEVSDTGSLFSHTECSPIATDNGVTHYRNLSDPDLGAGLTPGTTARTGSPPSQPQYSGKPLPTDASKR